MNFGKIKTSSHPVLTNFTWNYFMNLTIQKFFNAGDLIIILAQIISATQVVLEEKFVSSKDIHPLQAVGFEGFNLCYIKT